MRFAKLLRKNSNSQGKPHSASVFSASRLCDLCGLCVSASLRRLVHHARVQEEYGEATSSRFACGACFKSAKKGRCDAELMHVVAKSAKKGRRDAEDAEDAEACVVVSVITLPLVVA